jgi:hypothetical protein
MRDDERPWAKELSESSAALREIVGAIIRSEQQYAPTQSPLSLLRSIQEDPNWAWLKPLYQLVADIDHAADDAELPATEVAAIGAHARALLSGVGVPIEQTFLDRYRPLLQNEPTIAIAHGNAIRALRKLPPEPETEAERLHAHHQWTMRRKHHRS